LWIALLTVCAVELVVVSKESKEGTLGWDRTKDTVADQVTAVVVMLKVYIALAGFGVGLR